MPEPLFHSPRGLYPFQARHVGYLCARDTNLLAWDTGLGKSVGAMAALALLFEDGEIDHALVVCEQAKVGEWMEDFENFTKLTVQAYVGDKKKRTKIQQALPQVLVMTYETARNDLVIRQKANPKAFDPGPLLEAIRGKRIYFVYDEMSKLGNRTSLLHRAHLYAVKTMRDSGARVAGLTATPMERNPENWYNLGRILTPGTMGTVKSFLTEHVIEFDAWGNPSKFKALEALALKMEPVLLRKRKTDPDVVDQFPTLSEKFSYVTLSPEHQALYDEVHQFILDTQEDMAEKVGVGLLRQLAGHPASVLESQGELAQWVQVHYGDKLRSIRPAKLDHLIDYLRVVTAEGERALVYTYYVSILTKLADALREAGFTVVTNHGRMSGPEREVSRLAFRRGDAQIFLCSSAGERGLNLPEAGVVVNYELPTKHSSYVQRINRISRIDGGADRIIVAKSFIVRDSIEVGISKLWLSRNRQSDVLLDGDVDAEEDDEWMSSADRKALLRAAA